MSSPGACSGCPQLAAAYDNVKARSEAQERIAALERGLEEAGRAVALVRGERVDPLSTEAARLMARWSSADTPLPLPNGRPLVLEDAGLRLTVRRAEGDHSLLLLDETCTAPDAVRVRELGLTAREAEILGLGARGLSDARIAETLVVSVRTVEKHLEHAYRQLGVTRRGEAIDVVTTRQADAPSSEAGAAPRAET